MCCLHSTHYIPRGTQDLTSTLRDGVGGCMNIVTPSAGANGATIHSSLLLEEGFTTTCVIHYVTHFTVLREEDQMWPRESVVHR